MDLASITSHIHNGVCFCLFVFLFVFCFVGITLICAGFSVGFGVAMSQALGPFSLRAGVASSTLGIAQVCGSSLWIWLAAVVGIGAWNMLIGILIACSIVSLLLIMFVAPGRPVAAHEEIHHHA